MNTERQHKNVKMHKNKKQQNKTQKRKTSKKDTTGNNKRETIEHKKTMRK